MRYLFCKGTLGGLIVAVLAAGIASLPAVAAVPSAQDSSAATPKTASGASSHAPRTSTTKKATNPATTKSGASSTKKSSSHGKSSRRKSKKARGQEAPTPERISEIQEALGSKAALTGTPTGKWDDDTVEAMKKFQASQGLEPTGKLDALTLQKLGLGSQTAGIAAPVAPPNSVNRLRNTTSSPEEPRTDP